MGCLSVFSALLALALPVAVAPQSIVGAYVLLGGLTVLVLVGLTYRVRRTADADVRPATGYTALAVAVVVYAVLVAVVHVASA